MTAVMVDRKGVDRGEAIAKHDRLGPLAQVVEQWILNPLAEGSSPSWPTRHSPRSEAIRNHRFTSLSLVPHIDYNRDELQALRCSETGEVWEKHSKIEAGPNKVSL